MTARKTAIVQSSTAAFVMIVSFVNVGLLSLTQSIGEVLLGFGLLFLGADHALHRGGD